MPAIDLDAEEREAIERVADSDKQLAPVARAVLRLNQANVSKISSSSSIANQMDLGKM